MRFLFIRGGDCDTTNCVQLWSRQENFKLKKLTSLVRRETGRPPRFKTCERETLKDKKKTQKTFTTEMDSPEKKDNEIN